MRGVSRGLDTTRRTLHGLAELLAGPQHRATGTMRLAVRRDGFATTRPYGDVRLVAVERTDLLVLRAGSPLRLPVRGTYAELAAAAGLPLGGLQGVYADSCGVAPGDTAVTATSGTGAGRPATRRTMAP